MKSKIKNLTDDLISAIAPVLAKYKDYDCIFEAMCLLMARTIQATPDRGSEMKLLWKSHNHIEHNLKAFLEIEKQYKESREKLDEGVNGFSRFSGDGEGEKESSGEEGKNPQAN